MLSACSESAGVVLEPELKKTKAGDGIVSAKTANKIEMENFIRQKLAVPEKMMRPPMHCQFRYAVLAVPVAVVNKPPPWTLNRAPLALVATVTLPNVALPPEF